MLPPLDGNLYQGQKGVENCQAAVRDGGCLVLVSACGDGIGSDHFFDLARSWDREGNTPLEGSPGFGSHKAVAGGDHVKSYPVGGLFRVG